MTGSGDRGVRLAAVVWLLAALFSACGGESSEHRASGGDEGGNGGSAGSAGSSAASGGTGDAGASFGGSGNAGASFGGSGGDAQGGTGDTGPIDPPGPSFCGGEPCDPPLACCLSTGHCFDPRTDGEDGCATPDPDGDPQGRKACASSAQCPANEFCQMEGVLCIGTGHCQPIDNCGGCEGGDPTAPDNPCRVCGCDGNTYPNLQTACRAGVNTIPGAQGAACGQTNMEGGAGSSSIGPRTYTSCGRDEQCSSGSFCCTINGRCYLESDRDICVPPPPGTRIACKTTENCGDLEYCRGEGCDGPGGCVSMGSGPGDCGVTFEPVCGCDGTTYTSAACADQEGVRIASTGECPN